jgi:lipopolysaccharide/colanic/teichoic acid biosynthesis glycosyltransferase
VKRLFDIALSSAGLVASAPIWLLVAAAIRLEDGGPVFFIQRRVGRQGRLFRAFKFRSMIPSAGVMPARQAGAGDARITRVGRLLRATALDELPQLLNILRGDMSFVGPRPLAEGEVEVGEAEFVRLEQIPGYAERHAVRPGLTGITQVFARRDLPRRRKFRFDLFYVRRASLCLDLRLIALSFWITCRGRWEDRGRKV